MAKTNKYTSINFNDLYDKKLSSSSASASAKHNPFSSSIPSANKSGYLSAASRSHGMLVLSRHSPNPQPSFHSSPSPSLPSISTLKAQSQPQPHPQPQLQPQPVRDSISLRPLGNTGSVLETGKKESTLAAAPTLKSDKFVPPHLRPGFVAKEERSPAGIDVGGFRPGSAGGMGSDSSSPSRNGEDRRPKSGGGYGRRFEYGAVNRPRSGGNRPNSSG